MRKIIFNKISLLFTVMASMVLTSCLKDKGFEDGQYGAVNSNIEGKEWVSIPLGAKASTLLSLESKAGSQSVPLFQVSYDYKDPAAQDITVNLAVNNALVTAVDPTVLPLPAGVYTAPGSVTIKAGQRLSDVLNLSVNTSTLDPSKQYGIGFTITGTSKTGIQIPANLKDVVFIFGVKNQYDGIYSVVSGFVQRYSAPGVPTTGDVLNGSLAGNPDMTLATIGPYTVELTNIRWAYPQGGVGGIDNLRLTVDPATNLVTMFALGNATLTNWAGHVNKYDPATKTFYLAFRWNPAGAVREYEIVLKYKKPR